MTSKKNSQIEYPELVEKISQNYGTFSKRLQQVAKFILENPQTVAFETATVLSAQSDIPPSTFIRFANAIGFDGFNEIKKIFRNHQLTETPNYTERAKLAKSSDEATVTYASPKSLLDAFCEANCLAMEDLHAYTPPEKLNAAVTLLSQANFIYVTGLGRSFSVASYLAYAFQHLNKRAFLINGLGGMFKEQLSTVKPNDILAIISFAPYAKENLVLVDEAKKIGAKIITITDSPLSPLVPNSDIFFTVKEGNVDAFRSHAATLCLVQTLAVSLAYLDNKA